jgi:hypothetical protein
VLVFTVITVTNIEIYPLTGPDLLQYVDDSRIYRQGKLPENIYPAPGNPLAIAAVAPFLKSLFDQPEVTAGVVVNILSGLTIMIVFWITFRHRLKIWVFVPLLLFITNPIVYSVTFNGTSEALLTAFVIVTLFFLQRKHNYLAYATAGLAFIVRYDGIAILFGLIAAQVLSKSSSITFQKKPMLFGLLPVILMMIILHFQNYQQNLISNSYIQEMIEKQQRIPNWSLLKTSSQDIFPGLLEPQYQLFALLFFTIMISFFIRKTDELAVHYISVFSLSYILIHVLFPEHAPRYLYPLFIPYAALVTLACIPTQVHTQIPIRKNLILLIFTVIISLNANSLSSYLDAQRTYGIEIRHIAKWASTLTKPANILTLDPWVSSFYVTSPVVNFFDAKEYVGDCQNAMCYINQLPNDLYYVPLYLALDSEVDFWHNQPTLINVLFESPSEWLKHKCVTLAHSANFDPEWVNILEISPQPCPIN